MKPASSEHIGAAIDACVGATSLEGVDSDKLVDAGWAAGAIEDKGKAVDSPLRIYATPDNYAVIVVNIDAAKAEDACIVMAGIESFDRYSAIADGIGRDLQAKLIRRDGNEFFWRHGPLMIQLAATGTREKPSIRAGVIAVPEEKK